MLELMQHIPEPVRLIARSALMGGVSGLIAAIRVDYRAYKSATDKEKFLDGFNKRVAGRRYLEGFILGVVTGSGLDAILS